MPPHRSWLFLPILLMGCASTSSERKPTYDELRPPVEGDANRGAVLGRKLCTSCHGVTGDGRGEAAEGLDPPPRSFVLAHYRYRSTPGGALPTDEDLARVIRSGIPGTSMVGYGRVLSEREVRDLVAWVKSFSVRFERESAPLPLPIPPAPPKTDALVARGEQVYEQMQCGICHGADGSGDGWVARAGLRDSLGRPVAARDLRVGLYRSGDRPEDIYRTLATGMDGSPMPGYAALPAEDLYALVHYLSELRRRPGFWFWISSRPRWYEPSNAVLRSESKQ